MISFDVEIWEPFKKPGHDIIETVRVFTHDTWELEDVVHKYIKKTFNLKPEEYDLIIFLSNTREPSIVPVENYGHVNIDNRILLKTPKRDS